MAGIVAQFNTVPHFKSVVSNVEFIFNVTNPVDVSPQRLPNQRGQILFQGTSVDNGFMWSFSVQGGIGEFPRDSTRDFYFITGTNVNATVTTPAVNNIIVTTPVGDAGGRVDDFQFFPSASFGPTIEQTSGNVLTDNLIIILTTTIITQC